MPNKFLGVERKCTFIAIFLLYPSIYNMQNCLYLQTSNLYHVFIGVGVDSQVRISKSKVSPNVPLLHVLSGTIETVLSSSSCRLYTMMERKRFTVYTDRTSHFELKSMVQVLLVTDMASIIFSPPPHPVVSCPPLFS
jgi:hypothetical protein